MRIVVGAFALVVLCQHAAAFLPAAPVRFAPAPARYALANTHAWLPSMRPARSVGGCIMQMTDTKPGLADPPEEMVKQALSNAEEVLKAAGGCIDSLSFGREWKEMFPEFPRDAFKGTKVTSFNKLLSLYGTETFSVESTKKKEVKLYILKDAAGAEGRESYLQAEKKLKELADSPLGVFFDIRGGRMRAGGARALPPNLSSYTKLDELLDALEPNLVAFAGGVSVVSAKDAVTALNNIKRLQYQARWPVQQSRVESFVRVFVDIATRGISTLSTKSIALLLNAMEAFTSEREQQKRFDKTLQAASMRIQTLATQSQMLQSLPVLGAAEIENDEVFRAQAVAVIVTAYQRMGIRDDKLFHALAGVVKTLPAVDFDAQALANIANAYVVCQVQEEAMFDVLAQVSSTLTSDRWNPTALALMSNALVQAGKTESQEDKGLLHQLAEMQCKLYSDNGERVFSSPANMANLLSAMSQARVQHVRLFTCASVVVAQHIRLSRKPRNKKSNLLMPQIDKSEKADRSRRQKKPPVDKKQVAALKFMETATGADLAIIAAALRDSGTLQPDLGVDLLQETRTRGLVPDNTHALAAAIRAFGPMASGGTSSEAQELLSVTFSAMSAAALQSVTSIQRLLDAMLESEWKDGASVAKVCKAICELSTLTATEREKMEDSLTAINMPRHLSPAIAALQSMTITDA